MEQKHECTLLVISCWIVVFPKCFKDLLKASYRPIIDDLCHLTKNNIQQN